MTPALGLEVGRLQGEGQFDGGRRGGGVWWAVLGELALGYQWNSTEVALAGVVGLPLKRDRFESQAQPLYRVPPSDLGGRLRLTLWSR